MLTGLLFWYFVKKLKSKLYAENIADRWSNRQDYLPFWNNIHFLLECCGYGDGAAGWLANLPSTCCFQKQNDCELSRAYMVDCKDVSRDGSTGYWKAYVAIGIGGFELIGAALIYILYLFIPILTPAVSSEDELDKVEH